MISSICLLEISKMAHWFSGIAGDISEKPRPSYNGSIKGNSGRSRRKIWEKITKERRSKNKAAKKARKNNR
jgi:hypothetical protein